MKIISEQLLDEITHQAQHNPRLRMNHNLHETVNDPIQRLLNAVEPNTYLPPHRHADKEETYLVLRGSLITFFFDDEGNVTGSICLSPANGRYGLEIPRNTWHSIVVLESGTVIFEVKRGPYHPLPAEDVAPWAPLPAENERCAAFIQQLLDREVPDV
ncbi:MAG: WbuC family cupin fold metalloprotein [Prevotellaceae bacterium]|jgi:cupin fold WbuC family metalloprotein|nr:WbuC family cupin fold metalloprotein [Prevotellaceae bacterium]